MATYTWSSNKSGSWGDASNWGSSTPTAADNVNIGVAGITVSVGTGVSAAAYLLNVVNSTLNVDGGSLFTVSKAIFSGAFEESAGTYMVGGFGADFFGNTVFTGGTVDALTGTLGLHTGGSLGGTFTGAGTLDVISGSAYVNAGFACSLNTIDVGAQGGKLGFNESFSYGHNFTVESSGVVALFGNSLVLSGTSLLLGVLGGGKLTDSGTMTVSSSVLTATLDNGQTVSVTGTMIQGGMLNLGAGDAGAAITVFKSGQYLIDGNWNILNPSSIGMITNTGTLAKTFGGKTARVDVSLNSTGTIKTDIGTLELNGLANTLSGTVTGAGTLAVAGGQTTFGKKLTLSSAAFDQLSGNLVVNKSIAYGGAWDMAGGVLDLNTAATTLTLNGQTDLNGGTLSGYGGTVLLHGPTQAGNLTIGGPTTLDISGVFDQTNTITFGLSSTPVANIAAGASWLIEGDSNIVGAFGLIDNAGTLADTNGSGAAVIQSQVVSTGTITANNSTLSLAGQNSLAGRITGTGLLDVGGTTQLQAGLLLSVAAINEDNSFIQLEGNQSYGGVFSETGGAATLDLNGNTLALTGQVSLDAGTVTDTGTLTSAGTTVLQNTTVDGGATLTVSGHAEQTGNITAGDVTGSGLLIVGTGGTYTIDDDYNISGTGVVAIEGTLITAGTGISTISPFVLQTGTMTVDDRLLILGGGGFLGGAIGGAGALDLRNQGQGSVYALASGLTVTVASLEVDSGATASLSGNIAYGGYFTEAAGGSIALGGDTLTLSGTAVLGAIVSGAGTLAASGATMLNGITVNNGAVFSVSGSADELSTVMVGEQASGQLPPSTSTLIVAAGGNYTLEANAGIIGNGTLSVAGTLSAAGNGTSFLGASIVDSGMIAANLGTLEVLGAVGGSGAFSIGSSGFLDFAAAATIGASSTISLTAGGGELRIDDLGNFHAQIASFATGDAIEIAGIDASSVSGTYASGNHNQLLVSDARGDSITLTFTTAQSLSSISFTTGVNGLAALIHH